MNTKVTLGASILLSFIANTALAIDLSGQPYIEGKLGYSWAKGKDVKGKPSPTNITFPNDSFNSSSLLGGASLGYQFAGMALPIRLEAEYLRRSHFEYDTTSVGFGINIPFKSDITNQSALANLFVDIPVTERFTGFLGGGMGAAFNHTHTKITTPGGTSSGDANKTAFSWMVSAGAAVQATDWLAFTLSYRYSDLGDIRWEPNSDQVNSSSFHAHEGMLGFRLTMPSA